MRERLSVSVVVCTLNREASLKRVLASLCAQTLPPDQYEIIVVDNGSKDRTRSVVRSFERRATHNFVYCHHRDLGLSAARNRGLSEARGVVVSFIDDDAVAAPNWLDVIVAAFERSGLVTGVGGPVRPLKRVPLPRWLPLRLRSHLSLLDYGAEPIALQYPRYPFGTNMAVVRSAAVRAGGFDTTLGRSGSDSFLTGEETDLFLRMESAGGVVRYEPEMVVRHDVDPRRVTRTWIEEQSFWIGHSSAVIERKSMSSPSMIWRTMAALACAGAGGLATLFTAPLRVQSWQLYANCVYRNRLGYLRGVLSPR